MCSKQVFIFLVCVLAACANSIVGVDVTKTTDAVTESSTTVVDTGDSAKNKEETNNNVTKIDLSDNSLQFFEEDLYDHIAFKRYNEAVNLTLYLYDSGYSNVIKNVVRSLMENGYTQIFDYAYKVTNRGPWYISRDCFPWELRIHENLIFVRIISHKYNMALKYGDGEDFDGDTFVYGDPNTENRFKITWKFIPEWSDEYSRIYFKLRLINRRFFLKLGNTRDSDGDHGAYGSLNHDTDRHLWYVKPTRHNGKMLFFIINKEYNEVLKLGYDTDSDDDRRAYGHSKRDFDADKFGWKIDVL